MKKSVKRTFVYFAVAMFVLMLSGVFAESVGLSDSASKIVKDVAQKKGISEDNIESIQEVSGEDLPKKIGIENIDDSNLAVYEVKPVGENSFFVVTASDVKLQKYAEKVSETRSKMLLNFGSSEVYSESGFLETATGVKTSFEKGYVMTSDGSIVGLSTNLEVLSSEENEEVEIVIYRNGEPIGFRNSFVVSSSEEGVMKDYDSQSYGTVNFNKGDTISVYAKSSSGVEFTDVTTLIEVMSE